MKFRFGALLLTAFLSACGVNINNGSQVTTSRNVHQNARQTFDLAQNATVSVENVAGSIDVQTWDRPGIEIVIDKYGENQSDLANTNVTIDHSASDFSAKTEYSRENGFRARGGAVDYRLRVPKNVALTVTNVSGPVSATGLGSNAKISTTSGSITLAFDKLGTGQDVSVKAVSGRITIAAPKDAGAAVDASTISGAVTSAFASIHPENGTVGMKAHGTIGSGGATLKLETVSGAIAIDKAH